jgi:regulator of sigma E protease
VRQISGPIEIARISGAAARSGYRKLIWFMALISLQLGIFNLLPIPLLDGGHLAIIGLEASIRRDLSLRLKERILQVGFYAIILLFVVVTFNDIAKIIPQQIYDFFTRG